MSGEELSPYDLAAPSRMLIPGFSPWPKPVRSTTLNLGNDDDGADIKAFRYEDGSVTFQVRIKCDNVPHCNACECSTVHYATLTGEQTQKLKAMLGDH